MNHIFILYWDKFLGAAVYPYAQNTPSLFYFGLPFVSSSLLRASGQKNFSDI